MQKKEPSSDPDALKEVMESKRSVLEAVRLAYMHRTPFGDEIPDEEAVRRAAKEFIDANYALQRALFGKIRVKLSVAHLLR